MNVIVCSVKGCTTVVGTEETLIHDVVSVAKKKKSKQKRWQHNANNSKGNSENS